MVLVALLTLLTGAVLGTRYQIQILAPIGAAGSVVIACVAFLQGHSISTVLLAVGAYLVALQLGYLAGLLGRTIFAAAPGGVDEPSLPASGRSAFRTRRAA